MPKSHDPDEPTRDIAEAWRRFDPAKPVAPGSRWWVDCTAARDSADIVDDIATKIEWASSPHQQCVHELVAGHRGCGKSTELLRLADRLRGGGFFVSYFAATDYVDEQDVEFGDVLLTIARQVFADLAKTDVRLPRNLLDSLHDWFADKVRERITEKVDEYQVEVEGRVGLDIPVLKLMARCLAAIRGKEQSRMRVREMVSDTMEELMSRINEVLISAQAELRRSKLAKSLVIIVDNLDRVPSPEQQRRIFVEHADQLNRLACHSFYTVPTSLIYSPEGRPVESLYGPPNFVPLIKITEKDGTAFQPGLDALRDIVGKRAAAELFDPGVIDRLCAFSGGHPRDLVRLVRSACANARSAPVTMEAAEGACQELSRGFARWLTDEDFGRLRELVDDPERDVDKDDHHKRLLFYGAILPYWNGYAWYDVHPAIKELPKFKHFPEARVDG